MLVTPPQQQGAATPLPSSLLNSSTNPMIMPTWQALISKDSDAAVIPTLGRQSWPDIATMAPAPASNCAGTSSARSTRSTQRQRQSSLVGSLDTTTAQQQRQSQASTVPPGLRTSSDQDMLWSVAQEFGSPWDSNNFPAAASVQAPPCQHLMNQQQQQQQQPQGMFPLHPLPPLPALPALSQFNYMSSLPPKSVGQSGFDAYEELHGPSLRCQAGACAHVVESPCAAHKCACCKTNRQVQAYSRQGWCGPCGKREVVSGLRFVRCGRCKAEMLEATYHAHLKQNVAVTDENGRRVTGRCADYGREELSIDKGRRCGKCTNMRPVSFFPSSDTNCTCNVHQGVLTGIATARSPTHHPSATSPSPSAATTPTPTAWAATATTATSQPPPRPCSSHSAVRTAFAQAAQQLLLATATTGTTTTTTGTTISVDHPNQQQQQQQQALQPGLHVLQPNEVLEAAQAALTATQSMSQSVLGIMRLCQQLTSDPACSADAPTDTSNVGGGAGAGCVGTTLQLQASRTSVSGEPEGGGGSSRLQDVRQQLRGLQILLQTEAQRVAGFAGVLGSLLAPPPPANTTLLGPTHTLTSQTEAEGGVGLFTKGGLELLQTTSHHNRLTRNASTGGTAAEHEPRQEPQEEPAEQEQLLLSPRAVVDKVEGAAWPMLMLPQGASQAAMAVGRSPRRVPMADSAVGAPIAHSHNTNNQVQPPGGLRATAMGSVTAETNAMMRQAMIDINKTDQDGKPHSPANQQNVDQQASLDASGASAAGWELTTTDTITVPMPSFSLLGGPLLGTGTMEFLAQAQTAAQAAAAAEAGAGTGSTPFDNVVGPTHVSGETQADGLVGAEEERHAKRARAE